MQGSFAPADVMGILSDVESKYAPSTLYYAGDLELLRQGPRVSIVGTRNPSEEGRRRARALATSLASRNITVVSGLAAGIDAEAHTAAMQADGRTIGVLGTPVDKFYPSENLALQEKIAAEHLVVSQFPSGHPITPKNFPQRNRVMALLTDATVIVEAGEKSGTVHQGWEALRLGRLLFLLESVALDRSLTWPAAMIHHGAQILSRANLPTVMDVLPSFSSSTAVALEA